MAILILETIEDIKAHCLKVTSAARGEMSPRAADAAPTPLSPFATALLSVWDKASFSEYTEGVGDILSVLVKHKTGEDVVFTKKKEEDDEYTYPKYSAVVPLEESGGHDYPVNKPFLVKGKSYGDGYAEEGWRMGEEETGNCHDGAWRYATDAEIDELFADLAENKAFLRSEL